MPVPGSGLETEMLLRREMALECPEQANGEEDRSDDHMEAMEARGHEEGRTIDVSAIGSAEGKGRMSIFIGLDGSEERTQGNGEAEAVDQPLPVIVQKRVVRPGDGRARGEQDQRIDQWQVPGIETRSR